MHVSHYEFAFDSFSHRINVGNPSRRVTFPALGAIISAHPILGDVGGGAK